MLLRFLIFVTCIYTFAESFKYKDHLKMDYTIYGGLRFMVAKKKRIVLDFDEQFLRDLADAQEISIDSIGRTHGLEAAFKRIWRKTEKL